MTLTIRVYREPRGYFSVFGRYEVFIDNVKEGDLRAWQMREFRTTTPLHTLQVCSSRYGSELLRVVAREVPETVVVCGRESDRGKPKGMTVDERADPPHGGSMMLPRLGWNSLLRRQQSVRSGYVKAAIGIIVFPLIGIVIGASLAVRLITGLNQHDPSIVVRTAISLTVASPVIAWFISLGVLTWFGLLEYRRLPQDWKS
jgi:hypothetical protein